MVNHETTVQGMETSSTSNGITDIMFTSVPLAKEVTWPSTNPCCWEVYSYVRKEEFIFAERQSNLPH